MMRGYRVLKQNGQLDKISLLKQELTEQELDLTNQELSPYLIGAAFPFSKVAIRQYLLLRIGGFGLNKALLFSLGQHDGKVIFPLPKEWRTTIRMHGFNVANARSSILWQFYIFGALLYGALQIAKVFSSGLKNLIHQPKKSKTHVYFANLNPSNLPHVLNGLQSYDIVSWYLQWNGRPKTIEAVHHSVPNILNRVIGQIDLVFQSEMLPSLFGWKASIKYITWGLVAFFIALVDLLRGRWWHALLLNQAALSAQVRYLSKAKLASEYLFHNWIYRPLWTYDAEVTGSKIFFYFYSTNCESFKTTQEDPPILYGWKATTWPNYLVWDKWQADFVKKFAGSNSEIYQVGPIWFSSSVTRKIPELENTIAIFDVQPIRDSMYKTLGVINEYYTPAIANLFLSDISYVLTNADLEMVLKRKRNIGNLLHRSYQKNIDILKSNKNLIEIDCDIAASEIINRCLAVISMPFTSTALIARELGKPSVYYDSSGLISKHDVAAHGIPILTHRSELRDWIFEISNGN